MYKARISGKVVLLLIPFIFIALDVVLAEFAENPPVYTRQWMVSSPSGAAFESSENVCVVDRSDKLVRKSDYYGMPITEWLSCGADRSSQCSVPYDIASDSHGNVYVIDTNGISRFDKNGKLLKSFGVKGSFGSGIAVYSYFDSFGNAFTNVYVTNSLNHTVQKFTSDGVLLAQWGQYGTMAGQFRYPYDVAVDSKGNVYVADSYNWRIQKFDSNGKFLGLWPSVYPSGMAIDASDNVYVISWASCSIQKFSPEGIILTQWGSCGKDNGKFTSPFRIDVSPDGEIYVSDTGNNRIQVFRPALIDEDGDGIPDTNDNCPQNFNPNQEDADQDGIGDHCDQCPHDAENDADTDGICGDVDNCPEDPNNTQADVDGDGIGDICDVCPHDSDNDVDADGICGDADNCPGDFNSDQTDVDGDGIGDVCDLCDNRPVIGNISPSTSILWPPIHRMIPINIEASGLLMHNAAVQIWISSVAVVERNQQGENVYSENIFEPDYEITGALSLNLRSERKGTSQGRVYTITVTVEDCSGPYNFTTTVSVPHDKGK